MAQCYDWSSETQTVGTLPDLWFQCPSGNTCCISGSICLDHNLCHTPGSSSDTSGSSFSSYYVARCSDPTYTSPDCQKVCNAPGPPDAVYNYTSQQWNCCGKDSEGNVSCDSPTSEIFQAPAPLDLRELSSGVTIVSTATLAAGSRTSTSISTTSVISSTNGNQSSSDSASATGASASQTSMTPGQTGTTSSSNSNTDADLSSSSTSSRTTGLSTGAKAGIGIGVALGILALLALILFFFLRRRKHARSGDAQQDDAKENDVVYGSESAYEPEKSGYMAGTGEHTGSNAPVEKGNESDWQRPELDANRGGNGGEVKPTGRVHEIGTSR